jgi:hypothetical protein
MMLVFVLQLRARFARWAEGYQFGMSAARFSAASARQSANFLF